MELAVVVGIVCSCSFAVMGGIQLVRGSLFLSLSLFFEPHAFVICFRGVGGIYISPNLPFVANVLAGKLHKHTTTPVPLPFPRLGDELDDDHVVYMDVKSKDQRAKLRAHVFDGTPMQGGDSLWASQYAVYDLLSPGMQESLEALHSAQI